MCIHESYKPVYITSDMRQHLKKNTNVIVKHSNITYKKWTHKGYCPNLVQKRTFILPDLVSK